MTNESRRRAKNVRKKTTTCNYGKQAEANKQKERATMQHAKLHAAGPLSGSATKCSRPASLPCPSRRPRRKRTPSRTAPPPPDGRRDERLLPSQSFRVLLCRKLDDGLTSKERGRLRNGSSVPVSLSAGPGSKPSPPGKRQTSPSKGWGLAWLGLSSSVAALVSGTGSGVGGSWCGIGPSGIPPAPTGQAW